LNVAVTTYVPPTPGQFLVTEKLPSGSVVTVTFTSSTCCYFSRFGDKHTVKTAQKARSTPEIATGQFDMPELGEVDRFPIEERPFMRVGTARVRVSDEIRNTGV